MDKIVSPAPPVIRQGRWSWWLSHLLLPRLRWAECLGLTLTVQDAFGTPGDTISAGTVCRQIKERFPGLRINLITPNPELLQFDPSIDVLNGPASKLLLKFWYLELVHGKARSGNILDPTAALLGFHLEYKARIHLTEREREQAEQRIAHLSKPRLSINAMSRESVKVWPAEHWRQVIEQWRGRFSLIQLGDEREPAFDGVTSFAGRLDMRESMALLSLMDAHVGPDSFLMHAANGLNVPSVIIFGGSRPVACLGYAGNENLDVAIECGPCWIHSSLGESCPYGVACMAMIPPARVIEAVERILDEPRRSGRHTSFDFSPSASIKRHP